MPANVDEMFYTEATPWDRAGIHLAEPASLEVAGLNRKVAEVDMVTADDPPSAVNRDARRSCAWPRVALCGPAPDELAHRRR